jgi:hypothetical protein
MMYLSRSIPQDATQALLVEMHDSKNEYFLVMVIDSQL